MVKVKELLCPEGALYINLLPESECLLVFSLWLGWLHTVTPCYDSTNGLFVGPFERDLSRSSVLGNTRWQRELARVSKSGLKQKDLSPVDWWWLGKVTGLRKAVPWRESMQVSQQKALSFLPSFVPSCLLAYSGWLMDSSLSIPSLHSYVQTGQCFTPANVGMINVDMNHP